MVCLVEIAMPSVRLRFPRTRRLTETRDFNRIKTQGRRLVHGALILNWMPAEASSRLGLVTSKKIGHAVVRNRVRRFLRESFRLHQHHLAQPVDLILVARPSIAQKTFSQVKDDFLAGLKRAGLLGESP